MEHFSLTSVSVSMFDTCWTRIEHLLVQQICSDVHRIVVNYIGKTYMTVLINFECEICQTDFLSL